MIISFKNDIIKGDCENFDSCEKSYGNELAMRIFQRVSEFVTAENLSEILMIPAIQIEKVYEDPFTYQINLIKNSKLLIKLSHEIQLPDKKSDFISEVEIVKILV